MLKLFDSTLGYYLPSFLYIYTEEHIDFENFEANPSETKGTFMHEYCHYLQDISTTYGYHNFVYILQEMIQKIFPGDENNGQILNDNRNIYGLCNGDKNVDDIIFYINSIKIEKGDELFEYVIVRYNGCKEFQFGNSCIAESMAYLVERRLYKTKERFDEFPYNICEKICEKEYPEFSENKIWIMALCELSLLEMAGGVFFIRTLRFMKEKKFMPCNVADIENFINEHFNIGFRGKRGVLESLLENIYPKTMLNFKSIQIWILSRFEKGCYYREKCKCFISKVLSERDSGYRFGFWQQILDEFGAPNVVDGNGEVVQGAYWNGEQINLGYMLAPMAIYQLLNHCGQYEKKACPLSKICCQAIEYSGYSEVCESDPREKTKEDLLCPIGLFWRIYGIEEIHNKSEYE